MNRIVVASANPVKVEATLQGFQRLFPDQAFSVEGIEFPRPAFVLPNILCF